MRKIFKCDDLKTKASYRALAILLICVGACIFAYNVGHVVIF